MVERLSPSCPAHVILSWAWDHYQPKSLNPQTWVTEYKHFITWPSLCSYAVRCQAEWEEARASPGLGAHLWDSRRLIGCRAPASVLWLVQTRSHDQDAGLSLVEDSCVCRVWPPLLWSDILGLRDQSLMFRTRLSVDNRDCHYSTTKVPTVGNFGYNKQRFYSSNLMIY